MVKKVKKRNNETVAFDESKIMLALEAANKDVLAKDRASKETIGAIANKIKSIDTPKITVEEIQDAVETELMNNGLFELAKQYIIYRYVHSEIRQANTTDDAILGLIANRNKAIMDENSNKNAMLSSTQRDLIAGEVSRDLTNRKLLPKENIFANLPFPTA